MKNENFADPFGPSYLPDPELESVNSKIQELKEDKRRVYDILQAAASVPPPVPEKDWSSYPFYSQTLKSLNFNYPVDQLGVYVTSLTGLGMVSKALWKSYNVGKANTAIKLGIVDDIDVYLHRSGLNDERQVLRAMKSRHRLVIVALGKWAALAALFTAYVQLKNRN